MSTHQDIKIINKPLKHRFSSRKLFGEAWDNGEIWINPNQSESERLNTVIHESLHVLYPRWSEARVRRVADKLSEVLWRDGWRRRTARGSGGSGTGGGLTSRRNGGILKHERTITT